MRNTALGSEKNAREFGAQFFFRVVFIAEPIGFVESGAIQTIGVAGPVRLMPISA